VGGAAAVAGAAARRLPARAGAGGSRQHDPRRRQHLLGGQPSDRRMGRGPRPRRPRRGVVRPEAGGTPAALARPGQASHPLPARHRLAGAQAGRVRGLLLPRRPVPVEPLPAGLRPAVGAATGACGQGVFADPALGGPGKRKRRRGGPGASERRGRPAERGAGAGGTAEE